MEILGGYDIKEEKDYLNVLPSRENLSIKFKMNYNKFGIQLVQFDTEEERDQLSIKLVIQKHSQLFRFMFDKYTSKVTNMLTER